MAILPVDFVFSIMCVIIECGEPLGQLHMIVHFLKASIHPTSVGTNLADVNVLSLYCRLARKRLVVL